MNRAAMEILKTHKKKSITTAHDIAAAKVEEDVKRGSEINPDTLRRVADVCINAEVDAIFLSKLNGKPVSELTRDIALRRLGEEVVGPEAYTAGLHIATASLVEAVEITRTENEAQRALVAA